MRPETVEAELVDWQTHHVPCRQEAVGSSCGIFVLMENNHRTNVIFTPFAWSVRIDMYDSSFTVQSIILYTFG